MLVIHHDRPFVSGPIRDSWRPIRVSLTLSMPLNRVLVILSAIALVLGAVIPLGAPGRVLAAPTDLFFSEYIEGSSNNKALEIFNGTDAPVDLEAGGYAIRQYSNGSTTAGLTIALTGEVASGDVFVFAHALAAQPILDEADQTLNAGLFNGNDALELVKGSVVLDVIGQIGFDPGSVGWGTDPTNTTDNTLRRKATVESGDPTGTDAFDPAVQWDGFAQNNANGLGSHPSTGPSGVGSAVPANVMVGDSSLLTVAVSPGSAPVTTVVADLGPIGFPGAQPFFDDGTNGDAIAGDLTFSYGATIGDVESGSKVITATITDADGLTGSASISLTVEGAPSLICEIQGAGHVSPLAGQEVFAVEGIVTAAGGGGFWMTDPDCDELDATSNGIFVFGGSATVNQIVSVSGTVTEFRGQPPDDRSLSLTELTNPTVDPLGVAEPLPPILVGVDRVPPTEIIDNDSETTVEESGSFEPATDGIDFWESLEGMHLRLVGAEAVGPTNRFGEIAVVSTAGGAGLRTARGGIVVQDPERDGDYGPGDFNPERVFLDDVLAATPSVNVGDGFVTDPVGPLHFSFNNFKLLPTASPVRVDGGLLPEVVVPAGPHDLAVATFNVENLSPRTSSTIVNRLAQQIVENLQSPDLIAIEEIQDNNGTTNNGVVAADLSWQRLIDAIVAAGGPQYDYRQIDPQNNADGGAPGGNIRVGFLFHSERGLEFVDRPGGASTSDTDVVPTPNGKGAQLTQSPGRVLDASAFGSFASQVFAATRKSLAGEFRWRGETIFVVANHFSSKGDDRPLMSRYQPPWRFTEYRSLTTDIPPVEDGWRHAQAQVVNNFVDEIRAVDPNAHVIVLGDINDFDFSETVQVLSGERTADNPDPAMADGDGSGPTTPTGLDPILHTLFRGLDADERYSYVFEGNSQVLDQILVSSSLDALEPTYDVVHVNAEFFDQASDHDPSVMRVAFQPRAEPRSTAVLTRFKGR
jgi:predicted extracellular nuclease